MSIESHRYSNHKGSDGMANLKTLGFVIFISTLPQIGQGDMLNIGTSEGDVSRCTGSPTPPRQPAHCVALDPNVKYWRLEEFLFDEEGRPKCAPCEFDIGPTECVEFVDPFNPTCPYRFIDTDLDGIGDYYDECPNTPETLVFFGGVGADGCHESELQADSDQDGVNDTTETDVGTNPLDENEALMPIINIPAMIRGKN